MTRPRSEGLATVLSAARSPLSEGNEAVESALAGRRWYFLAMTGLSFTCVGRAKSRDLSIQIATMIRDASKHPGLEVVKVGVKGLDQVTLKIAMTMGLCDEAS